MIHFLIINKFIYCKIDILQVFPVITILWKDMNADIVVEVLNQLRQSFLVVGNIKRIYTDLCFKNCLRRAFQQAEVISTYDSFGHVSRF